MKILFITRGYPSDKYKTLGIFEYDMAKALTQAGHQVTYLAVDMRSLRRRRKWGYESFERDGIHMEAISIPLGRVYNPIKTILSEWAVFHRYKDLDEDYGPFDIIHGHFIGSAYLAARLKEKTGIPLVVTEHSSKLNTGVSDYIHSKLVYAYNKADQLTTVSGALAEIIDKQYGVKSIVIPNIADTNLFTLKRPVKNASRVRFASTGNLIPGKGMDSTIQAFKKLSLLYPEAELWIFGQGPERERLIELIHRLELTENVKMKGLVSRSDLNDAYEECDFFVLASRSETFGVAYIEALSKGIPVLATDCGGPREFVYEKNGILVPVGDIDALYEGMKQLIIRRTLYNSEAISEEIKNTYSAGKNAFSLETIYNKVIHKNINE